MFTWRILLPFAALMGLLLATPRASEADTATVSVSTTGTLTGHGVAYVSGTIACDGPTLPITVRFIYLLGQDFKNDKHSFAYGGETEMLCGSTAQAWTLVFNEGSQAGSQGVKYHQGTAYFRLIVEKIDPTTGSFIERLFDQVYSITLVR
jgi:hypothetical protein